MFSWFLQFYFLNVENIWNRSWQCTYSYLPFLKAEIALAPPSQIGVSALANSKLYQGIKCSSLLPKPFLILHSFTFKTMRLQPNKQSLDPVRSHFRKVSYSSSWAFFICFYCKEGFFVFHRFYEELLPSSNVLCPSVVNKPMNTEFFYHRHSFSPPWVCIVLPPHFPCHWVSDVSSRCARWLGLFGTFLLHEADALLYLTLIKNQSVF